MNSDGRYCPNGANADSCLCSTKAANEKWDRDMVTVKQALTRRAPANLHIYLFFLSVAGILVWDLAIQPQALRILPFVAAFVICAWIREFRQSLREESGREDIRQREFREMQCAISALQAEIQKYRSRVH